jgi:hypothetical membrane protein
MRATMKNLPAWVSRTPWLSVLVLSMLVTSLIILIGVRPEDRSPLDWVARSLFGGFVLSYLTMLIIDFGRRTVTTKERDA